MEQYPRVRINNSIKQNSVLSHRARVPRKTLGRHSLPQVAGAVPSQHKGLHMCAQGLSPWCRFPCKDGSWGFLSVALARAALGHGTRAKACHLSKVSWIPTTFGFHETSFHKKQELSGGQMDQKCFPPL